jgi:hypothetical protein
MKADELIDQLKSVPPDYDIRIEMEDSHGVWRNVEAIVTLFDTEKKRFCIQGECE